MFLKMKPNIGIMQALMRITCGLTILAWSTARLSRKPNKERYLVLAMFGAMKVGEGILKYCPSIDLIQSAMEQGDKSFLNIIIDRVTEPKENDTDSKESADQQANS